MKADFSVKTLTLFGLGTLPLWATLLAVTITGLPADRTARSASAPAHLKAILQAPSDYPAMEHLLKITIRDKPFLLRAWQASAVGTNRIALAYCLARVGDDEAADTLANYILRLDGSKGPRQPLVGSLMSVANALGFCAQTSDRAFAFVTNGVSGGWLLERMRWDSGKGDFERSFVASSVQRCLVTGLGSTGRQEALATLEGIRSKINEAHARDSRLPLDLQVVYQLIDAAFRLHVAARYGRERLWSPDDICYRGPWWNEWKAGGEGREWFEWKSKIYPETRAVEERTRNGVNR